MVMLGVTGAKFDWYRFWTSIDLYRRTTLGWEESFGKISGTFGVLVIGIVGKLQQIGPN